MEQATQFLIEHSYAVLFVVVLVDQLGLPVPVLPIVLAAGGLAGAGTLDPILATAVVTLAALPGDWIWYELGRSHGVRVVRTLCRVALEPDSCVRSTQNVFSRHGARSLLVAKWLPGLQTVAPPLAGATRMPRLRFLGYSLAGTLLWTAPLIGAGYLFRSQLEEAATWLSELGTRAIVLLGGALGAYLIFKFWKRRRFIRSLRGARITASDLRERLDSGDSIEIIDLRHPIDVEADPFLIPQARRIAPSEVKERHEEIPRDRDIVLYCT
jgi:membrane protein DedA with SNARE-associated domain